MGASDCSEDASSQSNDCPGHAADVKELPQSGLLGVTALLHPEPCDVPERQDKRTYEVCAERDAEDECELVDFVLDNQESLLLLEPNVIGQGGKSAQSDAVRESNEAEHSITEQTCGDYPDGPVNVPDKHDSGLAGGDK